MPYESHELSNIQLFQRSQTLIQLAQVVGLEVQQSLARFEIDVDWVESRIQQRQQARQARQCAESDRIRDELQSMGMTIIDQPGGLTRWHQTCSGCIVESEEVSKTIEEVKKLSGGKL